jgi:anti-sigma28 factor (negative regulator of flagellin synthesis)
MKIDQILQRTQSQNLQEQTAAEKAKEGSQSKVKDQLGGRQIKTDTVVISEEARNLLRSQAGSQAAPEIDDRIARLKARLDSGALLSDEIVDKTADAILKSGALNDIVNGKRLMAGMRKADLESLTGRSGRIDEIKQRVQSGYYNSPEVVDHIAQNLMEDLLA